MKSISVVLTSMALAVTPAMAGAKTKTKPCTKAKTHQKKCAKHKTKGKGTGKVNLGY